MPAPTIDIDTLLTRGVAEIIGREELVTALQAGTALRLKQGFDPSKPNLHVGHAVGLRKLRQFQELGHQVVLIVGDWTAQIGDPSGRDESRQRLTPDEVRRNAETYMEQFFRIVDKTRTEVRWQSEWFSRFTLETVFDLTARFTLADMMAHETFRKRWDEGRPVSLMELLYPLLQAYDSVAVSADVEFGGTDQKFNILAGRRLQQMLGLKPQVVFLVPLIAGTDGRKMSKSFMNTIDIADPPDEMFGKVMSMGDEVMRDYFVTLTDIPEADINAMMGQIQAGTLNPRDAKMRLAFEIVAQFHGVEAAQVAREEFIRIFQRRELPEEMPAVSVLPNDKLVDVLVRAGFAPSKSEARRLIQQGSVRINGERLNDPTAAFPAVTEAVIQVGPRRFARARRSS